MDNIQAANLISNRHAKKRNKCNYTENIINTKTATAIARKAQLLSWRGVTLESTWYVGHSLAYCNNPR
jgi:hypothetical protein